MNVRRLGRNGLKRGFKCPNCDLKFAHKSNLNKHKTTHSSKPKQPTLISCPVCQYKTPKISKFDQHWKRHEQQKLFRCEICDKAFTAKATLTRHVKLNQCEGEHDERIERYVKAQVAELCEFFAA